MQVVAENQKAKIRAFIDALEELDVNTGYARRFANAGQWALAFREVYYAATFHGDFYRSHEVEFEPLNNFFAEEPYHAEYFGFPL